MWKVWDLAAEVIRDMETSITQKMIYNARPWDVPAPRLILESVMWTAEYGSDIAETIINLNIEGEIEEV